MKEIKNIEILKLNKETLEEIKKCMDAYSENGDLYNEYGIEEDTNLFKFEVEFDNGYTCDHFNMSAQAPDFRHGDSAPFYFDKEIKSLERKNIEFYRKILN